LDPITDIFQTMHVAAVVHSRLEATAPWGLMREAREADAKSTDSAGERISPSELAHFGMISRGNCWLSMEGVSDPIPLTGGDCFLLAPGTSYALRDHPRTRARSFCSVAPREGSNVIHYGGGGAPTTLISGLLSFDKLSLRSISQLLPPFILVKADQANTLVLHSTLQLLASEMMVEAPGAEVAANRLAEVLFIQAIRAHIASSSDICQQGWLRAIFDRQIGAALRSVHENVKSPWTVRSMAAAAGMSRSAFASRFKELLGQTPLEYVTDWRMQKAIQLLKDGDKKLLAISHSIGYESDAAFSKAFKRIVGVSPGEYRRNGSKAA
jgi:AraC-like DNA-binding protein